jgi:hypothetical protein
MTVSNFFSANIIVYILPSQVMLLHAFPDHSSASLLLRRLEGISCASEDIVCETASVRLKIAYTIGIKVASTLDIVVIS